MVSVANRVLIAIAVFLIIRKVIENKEKETTLGVIEIVIVTITFLFPEINNSVLLENLQLTLSFVLFIALFFVATANLGFRFKAVFTLLALSQRSKVDQHQVKMGA